MKRLRFRAIMFDTEHNCVHNKPITYCDSIFYNLWHLVCFYGYKSVIMKKAMTIGALIFIGLILLASQIKTVESKTQDVIQEDELVLEDWMTKPFIIDTVKQ